jgi:hypothetical protein
MTATASIKRRNIFGVTIPLRISGSTLPPAAASGLSVK